MVVIAVVVATVSVVVAGDAGLQARPLRQEQPLFHGQVPFENSNLLLDIGHGIFHTFRGDDAQRVHGRDQVVVGLTKLTIIACVAHRPVKLLGVDLYPQSVWGRIPCHHIPGLETINDDDSQNDGRNHRPNQFQPVVVRKERGLAVLVISVLPSEAKQQEVDQEEDERDDPDVETHQPIQLHAVLGSRGRRVITVRDVEIDDRSKEPHHKHQPQVGIQTGIRMGNFFFPTTGEPRGEFVNLRQLP